MLKDVHAASRQEVLRRHPSEPREHWKDLGRKIVEARDARKLTQEEFAALIGCSPSLLSQAERGLYAPVYPWILEGFEREAGVSYRDWYPV